MSKNIRNGSYIFSQNFLTGRKVISRILNLSTINKNDTVLEIGAGKGHLTKELLHRGKAVYASEIDPSLFIALRNKYGGEARLFLKNGDFLKMPLPSGKYKVFSNIPFSLTTKIVQKLCYSKNPPEECWLIMEKGAAKRFCGIPNENLSSLMIKPFFDTKIAYYFSKNDFHPAPSVEPVLLHIRKKAAPDVSRKDYEAYKSFTARQFSKTSFCPTHRETLYFQWLCLFRRRVKTSEK